MLEHATKPWVRLGRGVLVSVLLHLSIGAVLWTSLFFEPAPVPKESIDVKLVPPPQPAPKQAPQPKTAPETARAPAPSNLEFGAATAKTGQKTTDTELPPVIEQAPSAEPEKPVDQVKTETKSPAGEPEDPRKQVTPDGIKVAKALEQKPADPSKPVKSETSRKSNDPAPVKQLFSEESLASLRVRQTARKMSPRDRIMQLCSIEALEQVRNKRPGSFPDLLVPFGRSGGVISDYGLNASGGAFRSKSNWYNLDFKCTVDSSRSKVVTFSLVIGKAVPKSDWNARRLIVD